MRLALAILISSAAAFKAIELLNDGGNVGGFSLWSRLAAIGCEILFAVWLVASSTPALTRHAAIVCFSIFGTVSLWHALAADESCGCFGSATVNPWISLFVDVVAIMALICFKPSVEPAPRRFHALWTRAALLFCASGLAVAILGYAAPALRSQNTSSATDVEAWIGKPMPPLVDVDVRGALAVGQWEVLFYDRDCPKCQKILQELDASGADKEPRVCRIALIDVTPNGGGQATGQSASNRGGSCVLNGHVSPDWHWQLPTPVQIELLDGVVLAVSQ